MVLLWSRSRRPKVDASLPPGLHDRLLRLHPHLDTSSLRLVEQGLRQWFAVCARADGEPLAMPSRVVDDLWHEFIVHTAAYEQFCRRTLGRFLHHTPEEVMTPADRAANGGVRLRRTYDLALAVEGVRPGLPLLFSLDDELRVAGGHRYVDTCDAPAGCLPPPGTTCLAHLPAPRARRSPDDSGGGGTVTGSTWGDSCADASSGADGGGGGGCGGGGCGGGGS